jgi:hypothetical protein
MAKRKRTLLSIRMECEDESRSEEKGNLLIRWEEFQVRQKGRGGSTSEERKHLKGCDLSCHQYQWETCSQMPSLRLLSLTSICWYALICLLACTHKVAAYFPSIKLSDTHMTSGKINESRMTPPSSQCARRRTPSYMCHVLWRGGKKEFSASNCCRNVKNHHLRSRSLSLSSPLADMLNARRKTDTFSQDRKVPLSLSWALRFLTSNLI